MAEERQVSTILKLFSGEESLSGTVGELKEIEADKLTSTVNPVLTCDFHLTYTGVQIPCTRSVPDADVLS